MQIFDNLHQLKGYANAYLYEDETGWVLVDTGMPRAFDPVSYLATLGHPASALKHIVITHADIDHIGGLRRIQEATGATVYIGQKSAELLQKSKFPVHIPLVDTLLSKFVRLAPPPATCIRIVADGDVLPLLGGLTVIDTPGHTADHCAFFSATTGILFAGDAVVSANNKLTAGGKLISQDVAQAKQSAIILASLTPAIFACGHGTPFAHSMDDLMGLLHALR